MIAMNTVLIFMVTNATIKRSHLSSIFEVANLLIFAQARIGTGSSGRSKTTKRVNNKI